ncbi:MAG TPA: phage tail tape measure protein [Brevibacillus sp.]|nr:phage tail tape measure protein [Brevibacillus sp.]
MAEIEVGNLVAKVSMDDTEINKSFAELKRTMKVVQSEFQAAGAKLGDFGKSTDGLKVKAESLTKQIGVQQQIVAKLSAEHAKAAEEKGKDAKETQKLEVRLNEAQAKLYGMQNALKETNAEITKQSSAFTKLSDAFNSVGQTMQSVGQKAKDAGKTLSMALTVPIVGLGTAIVKTGMDFEAAMSKVKAISGSTTEEMQALTAQAKELGATTIFSASQAASGMEFLARAGWDAQEIMAAMPGMLDLAASGALDLGEAADITSNIMSAFAIEASKAGKVADILAVANSNANTNVQQLGQAMTYVAPTAATMGQSIEQATAAVMKMSDAGIQGEKAGAAFSTSLQRLANPTKEMQNVMRELGITFFDAQGVMKPLTQIVAELETSMAGYTNEQKAAALSTMFGAEAYKNWAVLVETGSAALSESVAMLETADGAAKKMAETMNDNAKGGWVEFTSAVEGLSIALSEHLLPIFSQVVEKLTEWVRWFGELDPGIQKVTLTIAGIAAAIGPALVVMGSLISSVGTIASAFGAVSGSIAAAGGVMAALSGPVGIAIGALGALVAAGIAVYQNWDKIKAKAEEVFVKISPALEKVQRVFEAVWPHVQKIVEIAWETIKKVTSATIDVILGIIDVFVGAFTGDWRTMWEGIKTIASGAWSALDAIIKGGIRIALESIAGLVSGITTYFQQIAQNMLTHGNDMVKNLGQGIMDMATWIKEKVLAFATGIVDTFKEFFGINSPSTLMAEYGTYLVQGLWEGINSMIGWIKEKVTSFSESVANTIREFFGIASPAKLMIQYGGFIAEGLAAGIEAVAPKAVAAAKAMADAVISQAQRAMSVMNGKIFEKIGGNWVESGTVGGRIDPNDPFYQGDWGKDGESNWLKPAIPPVSGGGSETDSGRRRPADTDKEGAYQKDVTKDNFGGGANTNVRSAVKSAGEKIKDALDKVADKLRIPGLATGGTVVKGGWTLVGEKGPELLNLPRGSQVVPNYDLHRFGGQVTIDYKVLAREMAAYKQGVTQNITINSPSPLTPSEIARRNLQVARQLALEWK